MSERWKVEQDAPNRPEFTLTKDGEYAGCFEATHLDTGMMMLLVAAANESEKLRQRVEELEDMVGEIVGAWQCGAAAGCADCRGNIDHAIDGTHQWPAVLTGHVRKVVADYGSVDKFVAALKGEDDGD